MNDISIGAVGAAIIAGFVSILGLIIGKEQKVSEFRQAWIDDLRKCLISYLVHINAISDALRVAKTPGAPTTANIIDSYKSLNEASHGIVFRVNPEDDEAIALLKSMEAFEALAADNAKLTPTNIKAAEDDYTKASKALLKHEWKRVKRGESTYVWAKNIVLLLITLMFFILGYLWYTRSDKPVDAAKPPPATQSVYTNVVCASGKQSVPRKVAKNVHAFSTPTPIVSSPHSAAFCAKGQASSLSR